MAVTLTILGQPSPGHLQPSARPVPYSVMSQQFAGDPDVISVLAGPNVNGVNVKQLRKKPLLIQDLGGGHILKFWVFDFQASCSDELLYIEPALDYAISEVDFAGYKAFLSVLFQWESLDGNGFLVTDATLYGVARNIIIAANKQHREFDPTLKFFTDRGTPADYRFLTNKPYPSEVTFNVFEWLHWYADIVLTPPDVIAILTSDAAGAPLEIYTRLLGVGGLEGRKAFPVGPVSLNAMPWDFNPLVNGGSPGVPIWDSVAYYEIFLGYDTPLTHVPTPVSEFRRYNYKLGNNCAFRVHFRNYIGGIDTVNTFFEEQQLEVKSNYYNKELIPFARRLFVQNQPSRLSINTRGQETVRVRTEIFRDRAEADYFNELLMSGEIWTDKLFADPSGGIDDQKLVPLVIKSAKQISASDTNPSIFYILDLEYSHELFVIEGLPNG